MSMPIRFFAALLVACNLLAKPSNSQEITWNFGAIQAMSASISADVSRTQTLLIDFGRFPAPPPDIKKFVLEIDFSAVDLTGTGSIVALYLNGKKLDLQASKLTIQNGMLRAWFDGYSFNDYPGPRLTMGVAFNGPIASSGTAADLKARLGY